MISATVSHNKENSNNLLNFIEMKHEIVAQVHKPHITTRSHINDDVEHEKHTHQEDGPYVSRDCSVDEESQINSKIISLIENEMKREKGYNKNTHFTDSRPQSLSFYEDEKVPEELSGNLELLSPEERRHYRRHHKDQQQNEMNADDAYVINELYTTASNNVDDAIDSKRSRSSRKLKQITGIGDSREMMIPREKRKSGRKKRSSPASTRGQNGTTFHRLEQQSDIIAALEELQDDVFLQCNGNNVDGELQQQKITMRRPSPRHIEKLYVQRKNNRFEAVPPKNSSCEMAGNVPKKNFTCYPLEMAIPFQKHWMKFTILCHGLLGGLAFCHWLFVISNIHTQDSEFILHYSVFSDAYAAIFYFLVVVCLMSALEKIDFVHEGENLAEFYKPIRASFAILLYIFCLIIHLCAFKVDYKLGMVSATILYNETISNITDADLVEWSHLSLWRSILAFIAWILIGVSPQDNQFYDHLKSMERFLPQK